MRDDRRGNRPAPSMGQASHGRKRRRTVNAGTVPETPCSPSFSCSTLPLSRLWQRGHFSIETLAKRPPGFDENHSLPTSLPAGIQACWRATTDCGQSVSGAGCRMPPEPSGEHPVISQPLLLDGTSSGKEEDRNAHFPRLHPSSRSRPARIHTVSR